MVLSKKVNTKALIRLGRCAGWSAPVLLANPRRQIFSLQGPYVSGPLTSYAHIFQRAMPTFFKELFVLSFSVRFPKRFRHGGVIPVHANTNKQVFKQIQIRKFYECKIVIIFLPINLNVCFGCSLRRFF